MAEILQHMQKDSPSYGKLRRPHDTEKCEGYETPDGSVVEVVVSVPREDFLKDDRPPVHHQCSH